MNSDLGYPNCIGKRSRFAGPNDNHVFATIEDEIVHPQKSVPEHKLIYLQRLRFEEDNRIEYRFAYYRAQKNGRWIFARYSLLIA